MSISERKEREKQEMRDLILNTAKELFLSDGYEKTSIRKIADKIEYSPTTIYLYFKDKDEIFHALMEVGFSKLIEEFKNIPPSPDPFEKLMRIGRTYIKFAFENAEFYDLMFIMRPPMEKVHAADDWDCGMRSFKYFLDIIEECTANDLLIIKDPGLASMVLWAEVHGLVSLHIRERMIMFPEEKIMELVYASVNTLISSIKK